MLSNGLVALPNHVFLGVSTNDVDHAYLFSDAVPTVPTALLNLNRRVAFRLSVNGVQEASGCGDVFSSSCRGTFVVGCAPSKTRLVLLHVLTGEVSEFEMSRPLLARCWHPNTDHVLFLLDDAQTVIAVDLSCIQHHAAPRVIVSVPALHFVQAVYTRRAQLAAASASSAPGCDHLERRHSASSSSFVVPEAIASFVALSAAGETPGLPPMLLLVAASGDVYSVKLGKNCAPAAEAAVAAVVDEQVRLRDAVAHGGSSLSLLRPWIAPSSSVETRRGGNGDAVGTTDDCRREVFALLPAFVRTPRASAIVVDAAVDALLCAHHVVQPQLHNVNVSQKHPTFAAGTFVVDEFAGLHGIVTLSADGKVQCYFLTEHQLLSVDTQQSNHADVVVTLSAEPLKGLVLDDKSTGNASAAFVASHLLINNGNLFLAKLGREALFLICFPVWCAHAKAWVFLHRCRAGWERLPSPGNDPSRPPEPLSCRLPLDVDGYSVAIDDAGSIVLFPERVQQDVGASKPLPLVQLKSCLFLDAALRSGIEAITCIGSDAPVVETDLSALMVRLCGLQRQILCDSYGAELVDTCDLVPKELIEQIDACRDTILREEKTLETRHHTLVKRTTAASQAVSSLLSTAQRVRGVIVEAQYGKSGEEELHRVNKVLGDIKRTLNEMRRSVEELEAAAGNAMQPREEIE